jgi:hypothetical protein
MDAVTPAAPPPAVRLLRAVLVHGALHPGADAIALGILLSHFFPNVAIPVSRSATASSLIKMMIAPVIFCTVVHGIASMSDLRDRPYQVEDAHLLRGHLDRRRDGLWSASCSAPAPASYRQSTSIQMWRACDAPSKKI